MPSLPPYVEAREHLPVRAAIRGTRHDAVVLGWRGDRGVAVFRGAPSAARLYPVGFEVEDGHFWATPD